jgi:AAHS family 4-hydroxybenzoate transporter-like MFS transporter
VDREASPSIDVGALIDRGPWTLIQKGMLGLVSLAVVLDGFNNQIIGFALPAILADLHRQRAEFVGVIAAGLGGMAIGTILGGMAGDRFGRKPALVASVLLFGLATTATSAAIGPLSFGILRLIAGIGIGGALPNAATLAAEFTPARHRPMAVTCTIVCVPLGGVFGGLLAARVLPTIGWRALYQMGGVAPLVVAVALILLLSESPRFLARHSARAFELQAVLRRCGLRLAEGVALREGREEIGKERQGLRALFESFYRRDTVALWGAVFCTQAAVYLVFSWLPAMLGDRGLSLATTSNALAAHNVGGVFGALLGAGAIGLVGSRRTMIALALGAVLIAAVLGFVIIDPARPLLGLMVLLTAHGFFLNAVQTTLYALAAHIYLTNVRATGSGAALGVGRLGGILSAFAGAAVLAAGSRAYFELLVLAMAGSALGLALVVRHIPPVKAPAGS